MSKPKNALGKGLSALISEDEPGATSKDNTYDPKVGNLSDDQMHIVLVPVKDLIPGRFQPREYFDEDKLKELTNSIKENGVLQPILVRSDFQKGKYQIVAGERRWRACKQASLDYIPAVIKELSDKEALEVALVENIQRQSLTPIEEAEGYRKLQDEFSYTQELLAESLGKSRSHITNMMRLLQLPDEVKDLINSGALSMGHARALVNTQNPIEIAYEIVNKNLSVREAEKFAAGRGKAGGGKKSISPPVNRLKSPTDTNIEKDEDLIALENSLSDNIGLKVTIEDSDEGGMVTLYFNNLSELDKILQKLG